MEIITKLVISAVVALAIYYEAIFLIAVWRSQIDARATISRMVNKLKPTTDLIATRDPDKLYSDGKAVATVSGKVIDEQEKVTFELLLDARDLILGQEIEFRRLKLKIIDLGGFAGTYNRTLFTEAGPKAISGTDARSNVQCEKQSK